MRKKKKKITFTITLKIYRKREPGGGGVVNNRENLFCHYSMQSKVGLIFKNEGL